MAWKVYAILTQLMTYIAMLGGYLYAYPDTLLHNVGIALIAIAIAGQACLEYLKQEGVIEYRNSAAWPVYSFLSFVMTVFAMVGGFIVQVGDPQYTTWGYVLIAVSIGGQAALDYLKENNIIELAIKHKRKHG
jgi:hypothetical protein